MAFMNLPVCWRVITSAPLLVGAFVAGFQPSARAALPPNWRYITPLPQGNALLAAWAAAPDDLFAGGSGGVILRWNGTNWTQMTTATTKTIYSIHGLSNRDVWAVGGDAYATNQAERSLVLHWDGDKWTEMTPPNFSGWTYPFNAVHAVGPKDVWGVIDGGTFPVHYDGKKWEFVSMPLSAEGSFEAITSVTSNHVFFAGTHGQIVHLDSGNWRLEQKTESGNFTVNILQTLWAADAETVYAGGNWGQVYRRNSNGTWTDLQMGGGLMEGFNVTKLWGTSATDIYLLGIQSIRHFNGTAVTRTNDFQRHMRLQWFTGTGAGNRIYGVGPGGVADEFILDGQGGGTFSPLTVGGEAYLSLVPSGVASCGTNGSLIYGSSLYRQNTKPLIFFDGNNYYDFPALPPGMNTQSMVNAACAASLQDIVVAWDNQLTFERGVHRWNGNTWEGMGPSWVQPADTIAFWRASSGTIYACGSWRVTRWNGSNDWNQIYLVPDSEMQDTVLCTIWGRSDSEIYIGSRNGKILRFNGTTWVTEVTPSGGVLKGISGNASDVYAVGENALVWRRGSSAWQRLNGVEQREGDNFTQIVAGGDGVYAAQRSSGIYTGGGLGFLWRLTGSTATSVLKGLSDPIDILGYTRGHLYGIAVQSSIITDQPLPPTFAQQRVDLSSTNWTSLGSSGIEVKSSSPIPARPMTAGWRVDEPPSFVTNALPETPSSSQHWIVRANAFSQAAPTMLLRFHYDPAKLPAGFSPEAACLLWHNGKAWTTFPATVDPAAHTISTLGPASPGVWAIGTEKITPALPTLSIRLSNQAQLIVTWPVTSVQCTLESASSLSSSNWLPVDATPVVGDGQNAVQVPTSGDAQFYRLRRTQ